MVYILDGCAGITADERLYTLNAGEIIFHKPMEFHKIYSIGNHGMHTLILSFDAEGCGMDKLKNSTFKLGRKSKETLENIVSAGKEAFLQKGHCMIDGVKNKKSMQIYFNLLELFLLEVENEEDVVQLQDKDAAVFSEIVNILKSHTEHKISVDAVAKQAHLSVSAMKQIFHKYTGMGVQKYHTQLQIQRAMELLTQGMTVSMVSEKLSFSSPFYFSNVFKKETGMSPSVYQRQRWENSGIKI